MHLVILILFLFVSFWILKTWGFPMRANSSGFKYVHVNSDGTVRELNSDEEQYLNEEFHPADGARPYIKSTYWQKTPDRKIHGFLQRNRVPWWINISSDSSSSSKIDNASYMFGCKNLHLLGIKPFSSEHINSPDYQDLTLTGVTLLSQGGIQNFMNHLLESQYSIPEWTAKIVLEHGNLTSNEPLEISGSKTIVETCFETLNCDTANWKQGDIEYYHNWMNKMKLKYG